MHHIHFLQKRDAHRRWTRGYGPESCRESHRDTECGFLASPLRVLVDIRLTATVYQERFVAHSTAPRLRRTLAEVHRARRGQYLCVAIRAFGRECVRTS